MGDSNLTYEELLTVIIKIDELSNQGPLSVLSADEDNFALLTPLNLIIEPNITKRENQLN